MQSPSLLEDIYSNLLVCFDNCVEHPQKKTEGSLYWVITSPTPYRECTDCIALCDAYSILKMGDSMIKFQPEIYPYDQREKAFFDLAKRFAHMRVRLQ